MGCCGSKAGDVQEPSEPDQTKKRFRLITVKKPTKVPSPTAWNESVNNSGEIRFSAQSFSIPVPPLGKKPSSPTLRRRSDVRLASSPASPCHKNVFEICIDVHRVPSITSTGSVRVPRPPTGRKVASSPIKRRSGVRLATAASSSSLRAEDQSRPSTPEVAAGPVSISSFEQDTQNAAPEAAESVSERTEELDLNSALTVAESSKVSEDALDEANISSQSIDNILDSALNETDVVPMRTEDAKAPQAERSSMYDDKCLVAEQVQSVKETTSEEPEALPSQVTYVAQLNEERQVFHDTHEQKEDNEEALVQSSDLVHPSCESTSAPSTSVSDTTPQEQPQDNTSNYTSTLELEIQNAASVLAIQAIREALLEEETVLEAERGIQVIESVDNKDMGLSQDVEPATVAQISDQPPVQAPIEHADNSDTERLLAIYNLSKSLSLQALAAASSEMGIPVEAASACEAHLPGDKHHSDMLSNHSTQGESEQAVKLARILSAQAIASAAQNATSENNAVIHSTTAALIENGAGRADSSVEAEKQESDEELIVRGKAINITKAPQTQTSMSSNGVQTKASLKKRTTERAKREKAGQSRSLGTVAIKAQPTLNKKSYNAMGKSRSVGTMTKTKPTDKQNSRERRNRSLSLSKVAKPATGATNMGKKSSQPQAERTRNVPKKLMPLKTDSKVKRAEQVFKAAKAEPPKKTLQAKGGNKLPSAALKKPTKSHGNLSSKTANDQGRKGFPSQNVSKDKKASSVKTSMKPQISRKTLIGLAGVPSLGSTHQQKGTEERKHKPDRNTLNSSKPGVTKKKSLVIDDGEKKALDVVSLESGSLQGIRTSNSPSQITMKSLSEQAIDSKCIPKHSHLESPKRQSPISSTRAWVNGVDVKKGSSSATPSVLPKVSSMSATGRSSTQRSPSPFGSRISVDRIPTSSPIRIRSGSSQHQQDL